MKRFAFYSMDISYKRSNFVEMFFSLHGILIYQVEKGQL